MIHQPNFTFEHVFGAPIFFWIQEKYENTKKSSGPAALYRILTYCAPVLVCCALREVANTTKVHFNPKFKHTK